MVLGDNAAPLVNKDPPPDIEALYLLFEDSGVNENPAPDTEFRVFVHKTGRDHPDPVFLLADFHGVAGIRTDTATGNDDGFILEGNVGNDLSLSLITKKTTNDN
jgi:hypothetical protein